MRLNRTSLAASALALTAVFFMSGCSMSMLQGPPKGASLEKAHKIAIEAQNTKGAIAQRDKFQDALKAYQDVLTVEQKSSSGGNSPVAAEAALAMGKIQAGEPVDSTPAKPLVRVYDTRYDTTYLGVWPYKATLQNDYTARDTFKTLAQKFDQPRADLVRDYGVANADRIYNAVQQAKEYSIPEPGGKGDLLGQRMDWAASKKWQYRVMDTLVSLTGRRPAISYWFAMVLLAVCVKLLITPLTKAQFKSMKEMQKVAPLLKEISEKHKGDQSEISRRQMELYKEHGINPFAGCLPLLIQMPVLWMVYSIIRTYEIQFAKGTFLWITTHGMHYAWPLPMSGKIVFISAANLAQPDLILLVLYTASMVLSQKLTVVDPAQAEQQKMMSVMMPLMFFFLIGWLPSAFVLYWLVFNILQTWQQYHILKGGEGAPALATAPETPAPSSGRVAPRRRRRRR